MMKYLNSVLYFLLITSFMGCSDDNQTMENAQATSLEKQILMLFCHFCLSTMS